MCIFIILSRSLYMCVYVCVQPTEDTADPWPWVCAGWRVWTCIFIMCEFLFELQPEVTVDPWPGIYDTIFLSLLLLLFLLLAGLQSSLLRACIHFASNWPALFLLASFGCYWLIVHPVAYGFLHCLVFWLVPIVFWRLPLSHWLPVALITFSWLLLTFGKHRFSFLLLLFLICTHLKIKTRMIRFKELPKAYKI